MDDVIMNDNTTNIEVKSGDLVPNSDSSDMDDKFGEPQVLPRVGEQYQAEIPLLIALPDISQLTMNSEVKINQPKSFCNVESSCGASESVDSEERKVFSENESAELKIEPIKNCGISGSINIDQKRVRGHSNSQSSLERDKIYVDSYSELKTELDPANIFLGSLGESWSDTEYNSFLLSLYIFGKNLNLVRKFLGSKKMGDVLFFYYGRFYRSKGYRRWSECRKLRTRRCIYGQKIFTGWRQQELLSRLFPYISEGCQNMLVELSRHFGEGRMPFEEYVFALKDAVGTDLLINTVAIGKGKQDLTGTAVEPTKTKHIFSVRSELPIGKACSSLTSADIIKFLTGNFRLSKARSSDLFWEAVWPRLLAKGWHSEQPKDHAVSGSKQSLVFLIPGVKKFSRRRLVKGNHYFDSVSDVLNKVASDPGLLEIEVKAGEANVDTVDGQDKLYDPNNLSDKKQHCYLQPHGSNCNQDLMKFTIVDTSMVCGLGQRQVRELRSMPLQTMNISIMSSHSSESDQDTSEESENAVEQTNTSIPVEESTDKGPSIDSSDCSYIPEAHNAIEVAVENHKYDSDMINDEHSRETSNCQPVQPVKADCTECSPSILKKQKLAACNHQEFIHSTESTSMTRNFDLNLDLNIDLNESISPSDLCDESEGLVFSVGVQNLPCQYSLSEGNPKRSNEGSASEKGFILSVGVQNLPSSASQAEDSSHRSNGGFASEKGFVLSVGIQNLPSTSSLAKSSPNRSNEGSASENYLGGEVLFAENSETRPLIDLNISPEVEDEMERPSSEVILQNNDHQSANTSCFLSKLTQHNERREFPDDHKEEQTSMINRRQSTRNRPLTTKALEALEYRFLNSKKKRKNVESSHNSPKSQCLRLDDGTMIAAMCDNDASNGMAGTHAEGGNLIPAYSRGINLNEEVQYSF